MTNIKPIKLQGRWKVGCALDYHTIKSVFLGYDEYGFSIFDTTYTGIGNLLNRLKYHRDFSVIDELVNVIDKFIEIWEREFDLIIPVPPTRYRQPQPLIILAEAIGLKLGLPVASDCVKKVKNFPQIKDLYDLEERRKLLTGAYKVESSLVHNKMVLLFDDLYRSGATLNAVTEALYDQGKAAAVYVLAITKTRSRR